MLEQQMGFSCEIVLHDLDKPYESTIVDIRNSHITGRKIGSCGSNLGLEVMRGTVKNGDRYNYITHTSDGKTLRSSSVFFHDNNGKICACLCINQDIGDTLRFESFLKRFNQYEVEAEPVQEVFAQNVSELMNYFIIEGQKYVGKAIPAMERTDKIAFLEYLDKKGVFQIAKSSERICEELSISKYTLYKYLDITRSDGRNNQSDSAELDDINKVI